MMFENVKEELRKMNDECNRWETGECYKCKHYDFCLRFLKEKNLEFLKT